MSDSPSRAEIDAELRAAEARTETRITQFASAMELRAATTDHKIDVLITKVDRLSANLSDERTERRADFKETRRTIWDVAIGAVIAIMILVAALYTAGLNEQANVISAFEAALGVRGLPSPEIPKSPPAAPTPFPAPRG